VIATSATPHKIERKKRKKNTDPFAISCHRIIKRQLKTPPHPLPPPPQIIIHLLDREADKARVILIYGERCFKNIYIYLKKLISKIWRNLTKN
jgi:hypothetical protein